MVSLLEALGANGEPGYPGEHGSTAFLLEGWTIPLCRTFWTYVGYGCQVRKCRQGYRRKPWLECEFRNPEPHRLAILCNRPLPRRQTLEVFSAQLRNGIDLDALGDELISVVRETMQPECASLWLRPPGRRELYQGKVEDV
jgi:hypothetical protein